MKNVKFYIETLRENLQRPLCIKDFELFCKCGKYYNNIPTGMSETDLESEFVCDEADLISELENFNRDRQENCVYQGDEEEPLSRTLLLLTRFMFPPEHELFYKTYNKESQTYFCECDSPIVIDYRYERIYNAEGEQNWVYVGFELPPQNPLQEEEQEEEQEEWLGIRYENQFGTFELMDNELRNIVTNEKFSFDFNCDGKEIRYYPDGGERGNGFSIAKLVKE